MNATHVAQVLILLLVSVVFVWNLIAFVIETKQAVRPGMGPHDEALLPDERSGWPAP